MSHMNKQIQRLQLNIRGLYVEAVLKKSLFIANNITSNVDNFSQSSRFRFKLFSPFLTLLVNVFHHIFFINSKSADDESDDSPIARKIYNLTDILSTPSSSFYKYETPQQHPHEQLHYKPSSSSDEKAKTKERYYIYSHVKADGAEGMNHDGDKSRKIRSSPLSDRKQISRNISAVLESLMSSYENSQLPTHGEGSVFISSFITWLTLLLSGTKKNSALMTFVIIVSILNDSFGDLEMSL